jgi:hypothetical protein
MVFPHTKLRTWKRKKELRIKTNEPEQMTHRKDKYRKMGNIHIP